MDETIKVKNGKAVLLGDCFAILRRPLTTDSRRRGRLDKRLFAFFLAQQKEGCSDACIVCGMSGLTKIKY